MNPTTADDIANRVFTLLNTDPGKPSGLTVLDSPELPMDPDELPAVGVYLEEGDRRIGEEESPRSCTVRVEIRAMGSHPLTTTRVFREWILGVLTRNYQLRAGGSGLPLITDSRYQGFQPFGAFSGQWMAGALLDFDCTYSWGTHE